MYIALSILHLVISLGLVLIVLLQSGKGADIGAAFGGGSSQTVFGGRGAATFLSKLTSAFAILFMLSSLSLAILSSQIRSSSIIEDRPTRSQSVPAPAAPAAPVQNAPAPQAPAAPAPAKS
jgi:preprotein translocase subunit SecG